MKKFAHQVPDFLENVPESFYGFFFHYYRAEVYRETQWRNRLDVTTNWAIVVSAALLTFAFTEERVPHHVILINFFVVWFFLYVESRRFRYYSVLKERTRLIERQLLAPIFSGEDIENTTKKVDFKNKLVQSFKEPHVVMSRLESIAWRLRRNYIFMFPLLFLVWLVKIQSYPKLAINIQQMFDNARVWFIPGEYVFSGFITAILATLTIAFYIPNASHNDDLP